MCMCMYYTTSLRRTNLKVSRYNYILEIQCLRFLFCHTTFSNKVCKLVISTNTHSNSFNKTNGNDLNVMH